jgi:hypothetical protein
MPILRVWISILFGAIALSGCAALQRVVYEVDNEEDAVQIVEAKCTPDGPRSSDATFHSSGNGYWIVGWGPREVYAVRQIDGRAHCEEWIVILSGPNAGHIALQED